MTTKFQQTYRIATAAEVVLSFQKELFKTPKWRVFKRMSLKRNIKFWEQLL